MGYLLDEVKRRFGGDGDETEIGCRAVVDTSSDTSDISVCGETPWGRGCVDGCEVKYCEDHAPSDAATAAMGGVSVLRTDTLQFYIPESDEVIEVR